jgi:hypothetical protein
MAEDRPSLLKATAPWFAAALVGSVAMFALGLGGNPVGHAMITALPWLFWAGPAIGTWRGLRVLDNFAEEVPGRPEARAAPGVPIAGVARARDRGGSPHARAQRDGPVRAPRGPGGRQRKKY